VNIPFFIYIFVEFSFSGPLPQIGQEANQGQKEGDGKKPKNSTHDVNLACFFLYIDMFL
jgi:hypothetical protein